MVVKKKFGGGRYASNTANPLTITMGYMSTIWRLKVTDAISAHELAVKLAKTL